MSQIFIPGSPEWQFELDRLGYDIGFMWPISKTRDYSDPVEHEFRTPEEAFEGDWSYFKEEEL